MFISNKLFNLVILITKDNLKPREFKGIYRIHYRIFQI